MKKVILVTIVLILSFVSEVTAQTPGDTLWTKCYGGPGSDKGSEVQLTSDGGYIITGRTASFGAGARDAYLIRTDANGDTLWTKTYGGVDWDYAYSVKQTTDDGFIVVGGSRSFSSGGDYDVYLIKTDANGDTLWTKTYGGTDTEYGSSVQLTSDGGYIIIGVTMSYGAGDRDFYLIKTDADGDILWTQTYGGTDSDEGYSVQLTSDGGYIIVGETCSYGVPTGTADVWLIKTDADGILIWSQTYGGAYTDFGNSVQLTSDGGYIIAAGTWSYGAGNTDAYLIKTDANGNSLWTQTYGTTMYDTAYSIRQTADDGYIFTGDYGYADYTNDVWIVKTDDSGNTIWEETYGEAGGWNYDCGASIQITSDNNYIIAGQTYSYGAGDWDVWLLKIAGEGTPPLNPPTNVVLNPFVEIIFWEPPEYTTATLTGYNIYLDGDIVAVVSTDIFEYQYIDLPPGVYIAGVSADYEEGESEIIEGDGLGPYIFNPPTEASYEIIDDYVHLTWQEPEPGSTHPFLNYRIYLNGELLEETTELSYDIYDLVSGQTYLVGLTAFYEYLFESDPIEFEINFTGVNQGNIQPVSALYKNYPNPFKPSGAGRSPATTISFSTTESTENTELVIYNLKGQKVKTLIDERLEAGIHQLVWNGKDDNGNSVSSGVYLYKMRSDGRYTSTKKMILLK